SLVSCLLSLIPPLRHAVLACQVIRGRPVHSTVAETVSPCTVTGVVTSQLEPPSTTERSTVTVTPTRSSIQTTTPTTPQSSARSVERSATPQPPAAVIPPRRATGGPDRNGMDRQFRHTVSRE